MPGWLPMGVETLSKGMKGVSCGCAVNSGVQFLPLFGSVSGGTLIPGDADEQKQALQNRTRQYG